MEAKAFRSGRTIVITGFFALTVVYGVHQFLAGPGGPDPVPVCPAQSGELGRIQGAGAAGAGTPVPGDGRADSPDRWEPGSEARDEAARWRDQTWGANPFSGPSWAEPADAPAGAPASEGTDTVLRATSLSASGWSAVVGETVLREGDPFLGGRVVSVSRDRVVVRGLNWEREIRFPADKGN